MSVDLFFFFFLHAQTSPCAHWILYLNIYKYQTSSYYVEYKYSLTHTLTLAYNGYLYIFNILHIGLIYCRETFILMLEIVLVILRCNSSLATTCWRLQNTAPNMTNSRSWMNTKYTGKVRPCHDVMWYISRQQLLV